MAVVNKEEGSDKIVKEEEFTEEEEEKMRGRNLVFKAWVLGD